MRFLSKKSLGFISVFFAVFFASVSISHAQGSSIAQNYSTTSKDVVATAIVSTDSKNPAFVVLANTSNVTRMAGVVSAKSLIDLSSGASGVQVVKSGITFALVSDINGTVKAGDRITASPINGVGMRTTEQGYIVGIAQKDLSSTQFETRTVKDKTGKSQQVMVGPMPLQVGVTYYTAVKTNSVVPSVLTELANKLAGKNVSTARVLISVLIMLLIFISVTVLFYASVRSSIISIGRNPLAEGAVRKGLLQVGLIVLIILILGCVAIYFTLKS